MSAIVPELTMVCLGLNYKTAPVQVRERFAVSKSKLQESAIRLHSLPRVEECVLLSTCNRTEVYFWTTDSDIATQNILESFMGQGEIPAGSLYRYEGAEALSHMARVASGLDSMVIGETEIFGQLKDAYFSALEAGTTAKLANRTFQRVFTLGKKVRSSTHITAGPTSVGAAAVQLAGNVLGGLAGTRVLVVGAGDVARSTAQSLRSRGAENIFVANRSYDRAVELASKVGGHVIRFNEWIPYLEQIDIVIVSTASPVYVVSPPVLHQAMHGRAGRPLFLIDLSVPRNIDPACAELTNVHLYDIDDMESMAVETRRSRMAEISQCEQIIHCWVQDNAVDLASPSSWPQNAAL